MFSVIAAIVQLIQCHFELSIIMYRFIMKILSMQSDLWNDYYYYSIAHSPTYHVASWKSLWYSSKSEGYLLFNFVPFMAILLSFGKVNDFETITLCRCFCIDIGEFACEMCINELLYDVIYTRYVYILWHAL